MYPKVEMGRRNWGGSEIERMEKRGNQGQKAMAENKGLLTKIKLGKDAAKLGRSGCAPFEYKFSTYE